MAEGTKLFLNMPTSTQSPVPAPRPQQCEVWVEGVIRVVIYCLCETCDGSVIEFWQVRCGMVHYFGCCVLFLLVCFCWWWTACCRNRGSRQAGWVELRYSTVETKDGGNREGTEFVDSMESLLGPFVNVGDVLIKCLLSVVSPTTLRGSGVGDVDSTVSVTKNWGSVFPWIVTVSPTCSELPALPCCSFDAITVYGPLQFRVKWRFFSATLLLYTYYYSKATCEAAYGARDRLHWPFCLPRGSSLWMQLKDTAAALMGHSL